MTLQDYQIQLPDGSVVGAGANGISFTEITGLRTLSGLRAADTDMPQGDGSLPGLSLLGERTVAIKFNIVAPAGGFENAVSLLTKNWQNIPDPSSVALQAGAYLSQQATGSALPVSALQVKLPGRAAPVLLLGRPSKLDLPVDLNYQYQFVDIPTEWTMPDGVIYDATVNNPSCPVLTSVGNAAFPWTFPVGFGTSVGGSLTAVNAGAYPASPVYKVTGPVTNPRITNTATGQYVQVNITLKLGDTLTVDTRSRVARVNGVNCNAALDTATVFFKIPPGGASLKFIATGPGAASGQLTAYTLNTYSVI